MVFEFVVKFLEVGHLGSARGAQSCPKVEYDRFGAKQAVEVDFLSTHRVLALEHCYGKVRSLIL